MRRWGVLGVILAVSCGGDGEGVAAQCAPYKAVDATAFDLCVTRAARGQPTVEGMEAACGLLGAQSGQCRSDWLAGRLDSPGIGAEAAEHCGGDADCGFFVIDLRPSADLMTQIGRCQKFAGRYVESCVGHAAARWSATPPAPEVVTETVARIPAAYLNVSGIQWGLNNGVGQCPVGVPEAFASGCERGANGAGGERRVAPGVPAPPSNFGKQGPGPADMPAFVPPPTRVQ